MKLGLGAVYSVLAACLLTTQVQGVTISITPASAIASGPQNNTSEILPIIAPLVAPSTFQYKAEVDGGLEEGALIGSYQTTFKDTPLDPSGAKIEYTGGAHVSPLAYLLVKGGDQDPSWYLFSLAAWNGKDTLELTGFWPKKGAISHISLYGGRVSVNDLGGSAVLLFMGVGCLAAFARRHVLA